MATSHRYTIGEVSRLTGLSGHTIRAWERRYGAVTPFRSSGNQRLYTAADVERLQLLETWVAAGHRISQVARRSTERLRSVHHCPPALTPPGKERGDAVAQFVSEALAATTALDEKALLTTFETADAALSRPLLLDGVMGGLLRRIGDHWAAGRMRMVHEHVATSASESYLRRLIDIAPRMRAAPVMLLTTPRGQRCELGALMAAVMALTRGWQAAFVGADLPAEDIAASADIKDADAVALSIACSDDEKKLEAELGELRRRLGESVSIWVGGGGAASVSGALRTINARVVGSMTEWSETLSHSGDRLRE